MKLKKTLILVLALFVSFSAFAASKAKSFKKDNILVEYVSQNGGVFLYYVDEKGKKTPVLDTVDYGTSTFTGVLVDNNYFNLKTSGGVSYKCDVNENSLYIIYNIAKKVQLTVTYSVPSKNVLNIQYALKNLDGKDHSVSVKSIFDTSLGEWNGTLFSTEAKQKIKAEYIITDFQKHKTLTSSDGVTGIRFMMDKDFGKYTYKAVIAAKPFFETDGFEGYFIEGRGFNTVLSYNNSCVGFFFKSRSLKGDKEAVFSQRIEFAQAVVTAFKKVDEDEEKKNQRYEEDDEEETVPAKKEEKTEVIKTVPQEEKAKETVSASEPKQEEVKPAVKEEPKTDTVSQQSENKKVPYESISSQQTSAEKAKRKAQAQDRIRELAARIKEIEDDGKNTDRQEIYRLSAELNQLMNIIKE